MTADEENRSELQVKKYKISKKVDMANIYFIAKKQS